MLVHGSIFAPVNELFSDDFVETHSVEELQDLVTSLEVIAGTSVLNLADLQDGETVEVQRVSSLSSSTNTSDETGGGEDRRLMLTALIQRIRGDTNEISLEGIGSMTLESLTPAVTTNGIGIGRSIVYIIKGIVKNFLENYKDDEDEKSGKSKKGKSEEGGGKDIRRRRIASAHSFPRRVRGACYKKD